MRTILLTLCLCVFGVNSFGSTIPNRSAAFQLGAAAGGGGTGAAGPPVWLSTATNSGTSGTLLSVTNSTSGAGPVLHILHFSWYDATVATINAVTNDLGVAGTLITNVFWEPALQTQAREAAYYWTNSAMTKALVAVAAAPAEWIMLLSKYTNAATTSVISQVTTNFARQAAALSTVVTSSSTNLVVTFGTVSLENPDVVITPGSGTTIRGQATISSGHSSYNATKSGAASVTNTFTLDAQQFFTITSFNIAGY